MSRAASHQGEDWPYHEDNHGNMVPCLHNPCRLHGGSEIFASSLDEAYERQYDNNDMVVNAVVSRDSQAIARLRGDIRKAVSDGGYLSVSAVDNEGNMIGGSLPVIDMNVPDDENMPVTFEVDPSFSTKYSKMLTDVYHSGGAGGQVSEETPASMRKMRMFVTPDGLSGAALTKDSCNAKDDAPDYVTAVCKKSSCTWRHSASGTVSTAIRHGGRRLDCFDTFLPKIYGSLGFHTVARMPFNREYAPDTWDYKAMEQYQHGCPDVVFMSIKPQGTVRDMDDYDEASAYGYACSR